MGGEGAGSEMKESAETEGVRDGVEMTEDFARFVRVAFGQGEP